MIHLLEKKRKKNKKCKALGVSLFDKSNDHSAEVVAYISAFFIIWSMVSIQKQYVWKSVRPLFSP